MKGKGASAKIDLKLLRRPVRCPGCGQPAWVMGTKGELAEVQCIKCGRSEVLVRQLKFV